MGLVKLMGRDAGFIAMQATNTSRDVDVCLIPEFQFGIYYFIKIYMENMVFLNTFIRD